MESSNKRKIVEVAELRGAAAFLVLLYHSVHFGLAAIGRPEWPRTVNPFLAFIYEGRTGVALFIVLSGFILATGSFGENLSYAGFIRNRALRILPLAILVFAFSVYATNGLSWERLLVPLMPLAVKTYGSLDPAQLSGTIWTAFVEFQLYLIAPFLFLFTARKGLLGFLLPLGLAILIFKALEISATDKQEAYRISYFTVIGRFNQFLVGVALAYAFHKGMIPERLRKGAAPAILLCIFGAAILAMVTATSLAGGIQSLNRWNAIYQDVEGWLWAGFIGSYILCRPLEKTLASKQLDNLAEISFSLYVLHYSVLTVLWTKVFPHALGYVPSNLLTVFLLSFVAAIPIILFAKLSFHAIEEPFWKLRVRYVTDKTATPQ